MRRALTTTFAFYFTVGALVSFSLLVGPFESVAVEPSATCVGAFPCHACTNCKKCKYCKNGGTCGACSSKNSSSADSSASKKAPTEGPSKPTKQEPSRIKVVSSNETPLKTWTGIDGTTKIKGCFVRLEKGKVHLVKDDGKRTSISLASLTAGDKELAEKFEAAAVDAAKKYGEIESARLAWDNVSYGSVISYSDDRLWSQKEKKNAEIAFMIYVSHTKEFVELYHPQRQHHLRLFSDHMEANKAGSWEGIGTGMWKTSPRVIGD